jgi:hypothetical protein
MISPSEVSCRHGSPTPATYMHISTSREGPAGPRCCLEVWLVASCALKQWAICMSCARHRHDRIMKVWYTRHTGRPQANAPAHIASAHWRMSWELMRPLPDAHYGGI